MKTMYEVTTICCFKGIIKMTQKELIKLIKKINTQIKRIEKRNAKKLVELDGLHTVSNGRVVAK